MAAMIWSWLILSYLSLFILGFSDNLRGPLFYEVIQHFQVTDTVGALFFSVSSFLAFLCSLLAIPLLKSMSFLRLLQLALVIMALGLFGLSQAPHYTLFLVSVGAFGGAMGFMGVAQNALASQAAPEHLRSQVLSGLHSMYGLASFMAPLSVGLGLGRGLSWNDYFVLASAMALLVLIASFFLPPARAEIIEKNSSPPQPFRQKRLALWACGMSGFYVIAEILVGSRLSLYAIREFGLTTAEASQHVTGFYLGLLSGRIAGIFVRWPSTYRNHLAYSLAISFIGYILGLYLNPWFFILTGLGMSVFFPTVLAYAASCFRGREGVLFSLITANQSIMIVTMHILVGAVSDWYDIKWAFHLGLMFLVLSALSLWRFEVEKNRRS